MPNSYAVVPDILPGSVTIGGDLTVKGSTFKLGQNPKKYRIQELGNGDFRETVNVDKLAVAQDQPGDPSCMLRHLATLPGWQFYWQPVGNPALDNQLAKLFNTLFEVDTPESIAGLLTATGHIAGGAQVDGALTVTGLLTPSGHIATGVICDGTLTITGLLSPNGNIAGGARVQGNLNVDGPALKFGSNTRKWRVQEIANGIFYLTVNLDRLGAAQDDAASPSMLHSMSSTAPFWEWDFEPAGSPLADTVMQKLTTGSLQVLLDELRLGAASPYARLMKNTSGDVAVTRNLQTDSATRDDAGAAASGFGLSINAAAPFVRLLNAAGNVVNDAFPLALFTDYTAHAHTGTVTEDTIYSKLIRGGMIGANGGLLIRMGANVTAQGAGSTTVRIKLGGTALTLTGITATGTHHWDLAVCNRNAQNSQVTELVVIVSTSVLATAQGTGAIDTSVDQTLSVTVQNANAADAQTFNVIEVHLLNSFGPV